MQCATAPQAIFFFLGKFFAHIFFPMKLQTKSIFPLQSKVLFKEILSSSRRLSCYERGLYENKKMRVFCYHEVADTLFKVSSKARTTIIEFYAIPEIEIECANFF